MRIRFPHESQDVEDEIGRFTIAPVNWAHGGPTLAELVTHGVDMARPSPRMIITVVHRDGLLLRATRLCGDEFSTAEEAASAIRDGFEVLNEATAETFARRALSARVAEIPE